jgi:hypothetical protein
MDAVVEPLRDRLVLSAAGRTISNHPLNLRESSILMSHEKTLETGS